MYTPIYSSFKKINTTFSIIIVVLTTLSRTKKTIYIKDSNQPLAKHHNGVWRFMNVTSVLVSQ